MDVSPGTLLSYNFNGTTPVYRKWLATDRVVVGSMLVDVDSDMSSIVKDVDCCVVVSVIPRPGAGTTTYVMTSDVMGWIYFNERRASLVGEAE